MKYRHLGLFLIMVIGLCGSLNAGSYTGVDADQSSVLPFALDSYGDAGETSLWKVLKGRVMAQPFNLVTTLIFFAAVVHTFIAFKFEKMAHKYQEAHLAEMKRDGGRTKREDMVCFKAEVFHFLGEIEAVFGMWLIPLVLSIIYFHGWGAVVDYLDHKVQYVEPFFVVVIMTIASTRPVLKFADTCMRRVAKLGKESPTAWWFSILTIGPLLGSFITEPAAMTISALLLAQQFYDLKPSARLCYATLGLLFVNISVGGTLTHFAAPPVLMVAGTWGWDMPYMLTHFGLKAVMGILIANVVYYMIFKKDFKALNEQKEQMRATRREAIDDEEVRRGKDWPIPIPVTLVHLLFLAWTVFTLHHMPLFVGGFLFFLAFTQVTMHHQFQLKLRMPLLVGFFLVGLVIHGGLQQWWIEPVLSSLTELPLFVGSAALTAFNDNAAITFLASLVPAFQDNEILQNAVVAGAVTGGGLTVIANAPNPAGRSILAKFFDGGMSPLKLLYGALIPTIIVGLCFRLIPSF